MPEGATTPRKGMPDPKLSEEEFTRRFLDQFRDPAFRDADDALQRRDTDLEEMRQK